ncbi:hypothetical protein GTQ99_17410, partial [Kineococcus sp. T13]|nr:hypothetical protein [Kineococcus vitellinus]
MTTDEVARDALLVDPNAEPHAGPPPHATCDLTMKGGITSGVVYPRAVTVLSRHYRFVNLGGASAGAIAAALAAAAECGRSVAGAGFRRLDDVAEELAGRREVASEGRTGLMSLFEPAGATTPLFSLLTAGLDVAAAVRGRVAPRAPVSVAETSVGVAEGSAARVPARRRPAWSLVKALGLVAASRRAGLRLALAVAPGSVVLLTSVITWDEDDGAGSWLPVLSGGVGAGLVVVGAVVGLGWSVAHLLRVEVPRNSYGILTGLGRQGSTAALTPWLAARLDELAGRGTAQRPGPLTFAHLWGARTPEQKAACRRDRELRAVNLEVMTTDLVQGRPRRLPPVEDELLYFREQEWLELFPEPI